MPMSVSAIVDVRLTHVLHRGLSLVVCNVRVHNVVRNWLGSLLLHLLHRSLVSVIPVVLLRCLSMNERGLDLPNRMTSCRSRQLCTRLIAVLCRSCSVTSGLLVDRVRLSNILFILALNGILVSVAIVCSRLLNCCLSRWCNVRTFRLYLVLGDMLLKFWQRSLQATYSVSRVLLPFASVLLGMLGVRLGLMFIRILCIYVSRGFSVRGIRTPYSYP